MQSVAQALVAISACRHRTGRATEPFRRARASRQHRCRGTPDECRYVDDQASSAIEVSGLYDRLVMTDTTGWYHMHGPRGTRRLRASTWWYRSGRFFRLQTVDLNTVGWAAVVCPGIVTGAIVSGLIHRPVPAGMVVGASLAWAVYRALDERRFRNRPTCRVIGDRDKAEEVVAALIAAGVPATVVETLLSRDNDGEPEVGFGVRYQQRYARTAESTLNDDPWV